MSTLISSVEHSLAVAASDTAKPEPLVPDKRDNIGSYPNRSGVPSLLLVSEVCS